MIQRLLEAGYSGKVTKNPPLKNAEITSVCLAAREVFLSQPTLIELSPPVKIVGDVHGQASRGFPLSVMDRSSPLRTDYSSKTVRRPYPTIRDVRVPAIGQLPLPGRLR